MKMGRLTAFLMILFLILAVPVTTLVFADDEENVSICHFPGGKDEGHVITVDAAAVDVHIQMHGDSTKYKTDKDGKTCFRVCQIKECGKGQVLDPKLCKCVPKSTGCEPIKCPPGESQDPKTGKCRPDGGTGK